MGIGRTLLSIIGRIKTSPSQRTSSLGISSFLSHRNTHRSNWWMWCNVTSGKLQNLILRDLRQSRTKSPPSPTRQLHHDRSPTRPQVPSKKSPLRLQNAFDVPPPYVRSFLLLLYILRVLPSAGRHFSFIDRNTFLFLSPLPRRLIRATTTTLVPIPTSFVVDHLPLPRSQVCSCRRW